MRIAAILMAVSLMAIPAMGQANVDFEQPAYVIGSLDGQSGGGVTWQEFEPESDASVVVPGYNSDQAARWDVKDLGTDSDGDDMLGFFANGQASIFSVSAMSFVHLEANRPNGTSRAGHFFVSDADFYGSAITWLENGNVGYWGGGGFFINDTGVPAIYDQWVPIELQLNYTANQVTVFYNGVQVAQDTLTGVGSGYATQMDIWLDTVALADNPNPGDWATFDNIVITPEPFSLALLAVGGLALLRRR
jgi:hypothetical protein